MTKLSVNINKIALLRNARGGNLPDVLQWALDIEIFGANGITVHPRPDGRHIRYDDVYALKEKIKTELNVEGNPTRDFVDMVLKVKPAQVTLVPDAPDALTSNAGWDTITHRNLLKDCISEFKKAGIRTSVFIDTDTALIEAAAATGTDRIELYTEVYAKDYFSGKEDVVKPYVAAAERALHLGIEVNAGHDLNLDNLEFFTLNIPQLSEVSIGHALIADALIYGMQNTVNMYLRLLNKTV